MTKMMLIASMLFAGSFAHADGFSCQTEDGSLNVKIYNHTSPNAGTRNAAVMVLSDTSVGAGNKTIARFDAEAGTLKSKNVVYTAKVDLRFADISRKGENVLGTKLGQLSTVKVALNFYYNMPVAQGEEVSGTIAWVKRNGQEGQMEVLCERYLKN